MFLLHHWFPYPTFSDHLLNLHLFLLLSSTASSPQGPRIYLCPSSPSLSCGSLHLKKSCLLLSESNLAPHQSSLVSPVLRKSVSFSEELFLAASGRIKLCQLFNPYVLSLLKKLITLYCKELLNMLYRMYLFIFLLVEINDQNLS